MKIADNASPKAHALEIKNRAFKRDDQRRRAVRATKENIAQSKDSKVTVPNTRFHTTDWEKSFRKRRQTSALQRQEKKLSEGQELRLLASSSLQVLQKKADATLEKNGPFVHPQTDGRSGSPKRKARSDSKKESNTIRERDISSGKAEANIGSGKPGAVCESCQTFGKGET